ncbi:hypothetical protein KKD84_04425 [Patescibacteria group bacterium]|nr:hypothetical protein [Patescibacteria group bacterium]
MNLSMNLSGRDCKIRRVLQTRGNSWPKKPYQLVYYEAFIPEKAARECEFSIKRSGSVYMPLRRKIKKSLKDWQKSKTPRRYVGMFLA